MIDRNHLRNRNVVFRIKEIPSVYAGTVRNIEPDGLWIETAQLLQELYRDAAWGKSAGQLENPILFVPTSSMTFLFAAAEIAM